MVHSCSGQSTQAQALLVVYLSIYLSIYLYDIYRHIFLYTSIHTYIYKADANAAAKELADAAHVCGRRRTYGVCGRMLAYAETGDRSRSSRRDASVYADVCRRILIYVYAVVC